MQQYSLTEHPSILNRFLAEMRDCNIQKDSMRFRRNMERVGEVFAYEISKKLNYRATDVQTPLGVATTKLPADTLVLATILRAGLPLHQGFLNVFDKAGNAFIAAYRKYGNDNKFTIQFEYLSSPDVTGKVLILMDPMLATGASMVLAYQALVSKGKPTHTHVVCPIASRDGVEYLQRNLPEKEASLWVGDVDPELTIKSYIVPGLGDAGDLAYGGKI